MQHRDLYIASEGRIMNSLIRCQDCPSDLAEFADRTEACLHPWYALRVRSKFETVASTILRGKGYEEFLPVYPSNRRWSDRVKLLDLPLFPGYLFCRLEINGRLLPILTTPGVISIVSAGKTPVPVAEDQITAVKAIIRSGLSAQPYPFVSVGTRVFIERGPLTGVEGIVTSMEKKYRLVVSLPLLQRSVAVEIDRDWARPVGAWSGLMP
jgi:transcription antitermination factor NusG